MFTNNRDAYRQLFFTVWQKYQKKLPLESEEKHMVAVMLLHPEYHALLAQPTAYQKQTFTLEENPFFHLSLHLAVREQLRTGRPEGVLERYQTLCQQHASVLQAEHLMMTCLAQVMWTAQQQGTAPSEEDYLMRLKNL